jgi:glycosyltransferase involved in cell wall biosynthesis
MNRISLVARYSWISISTPLNQVANFLVQKKIKFDIVTDLEQVVPLNKAPGFNYELHERLFSRTFPLIFLKGLFFKEKKQSVAICFDTASIIFAFFLRTYRSYYYISLEFLEFKQTSRKLIFFSCIIEFLERLAVQNCKFVVTQSKARADYIQHRYNLKDAQIRVLPNSSTGSRINIPSNYLRQKFNIPDSKKVVLFIGSLMEETCVIDFLEAIPGTSEEFVFVFHGWFPNMQIREKFLKIASQLPGRIYLSEELLEEQQKFLLIRGADVGCVFFKPLSYNYALGLGSAGKLFDFMRCGVPVIVNNSSEGADLSSKFKVAVTTDFVDLQSSLKSALDIDTSFCYSYFERNEFSKKFEEIFVEIQRNDL